MTANMIKYWEYRENAMHNRRSEAIAERSQSEAERHNVQSEILVSQQNEELKRHNIAQEEIGVLQARASELGAKAAQASAAAANLQARVASMRASTDAYYSELASRREDALYDARIQDTLASARLKQEQALTESSKRVQFGTGAIGDLASAFSTVIRLLN